MQKSSGLPDTGSIIHLSKALLFRDLVLLGFEASVTSWRDPVEAH